MRLKNFRSGMILEWLCLVLAALLACAAAISQSRAPSATSQESSSAFSVSLTGPGSESLILSALARGTAYSLLASIEDPMEIGDDIVQLSLHDARSLVTSKRLHAADPDFHVMFSPHADGDGRVQFEIEGGTTRKLTVSLSVNPWSAPSGSLPLLEVEPNDSWEQANRIILGETVYAGADDAPFVAVGEDRDRAVLDRGVDWYRLEQSSDKPRLVYFQIDLDERDNIPVDVRVYRMAAGNLEAYEEGMDPVSPPHETQALEGNKFTTRVLRRGEYFVRVAAGHPAYSLSTRVYDPPPYDDPRQAIRAAMDYMAGAGDSWHANTPRRGAVTDRLLNYHPETSTCIACHPTHFSTRGTFVAHANGYPVRMRREIQFLTERLYNNPRPFHGFPEASWARMISAPANVLGRLSGLLQYFENRISKEQRPDLHRGVAEYLKLYYRGRTKLPGDETNGNTPIVSTYEVGLYSWMVFDELFRRTKDPEVAEFRDRVRTLLEEDSVKNMLDLTYQTIAFATIDAARYRQRIRANGERILSLQRPSGQWAMHFEAEAPEAEFQTGHCLYALALAGYPSDDPRIAKGLRYLMQRQQPFGAWFDPQQAYENFRTPFRESQFAVMALSSYFKGPGSDGWMSEASVAERDPRLDFKDGLGAVLRDLDGIWEKPKAATLARIRLLVEHPEPLVRRAALVTLGRIADAGSVAAVSRGLSDPSKMVQIAAAWSLRQTATRAGAGIPEIETALRSPSARTRWGASRVFSTHFSTLSANAGLADAVVAMMEDPLPSLRIQASRALWQWWYWNADEGLRGRFEDAILRRMALEEDAAVRRNLSDSLYNILDDNVRYLYNNWIPLLARAEDRERATAGHHAVGLAQANRIARALTDGIETPGGRIQNDRLRDGILSGLTQFHLRHSDASRPENYVRIGNDIETIKFYSRAVEVLEPVFSRLIEDPSPEVRARMVQASAVLRDSPAHGYAASVIRRLLDPDEEVRRMASRFHRMIPLPMEGDGLHSTGTLVAGLLHSEHPIARQTALDIVDASRGKLGKSAEIESALAGLLSDAKGDLRAPALRAASVFPGLMNDPGVQAVVRDALVASLRRSTADTVRDPLLAAVFALVLTQPAWTSDSDTVRLMDRLINGKSQRIWRLILEVAESNGSALENLQVVSLIHEALLSKDEPLVRRAREMVRKNPTLADNSGIAAALREIGTGDAAAGRESYSVGSGANRGSSRSLDFAFFVSKVMPIMAAPGADGSSCVKCHSSHAILKLNAPQDDGSYTEDQLRENYRSALRVVDVASPEESLLLRKPLTSAEAEGIAGSRRLAHGGGIRWQGTADPAYTTILDWIRGAKASSEDR